MKSQQKTLDSFLGKPKKRAGDSTSDSAIEPKRQKTAQTDEKNQTVTTDFESTFVSHLRDPKWKEVLEPEFEKPYFKQLLQFLKARKEAGAVIFPSEANVFNAFNLTPFDKVKVVILGQDPYHGPGQAHGLAFSVPVGVKPPPSLKNIFKELKNDISGFTMPKHGCLVKWAQQGVLLLNAVLTVEQGKPMSHQNKGTKFAIK
jgi:uracil-DNA glycosylase